MLVKLNFLSTLFVKNMNNLKTKKKILKFDTMNWYNSKEHLISIEIRTVPLYSHWWIIIFKNKQHNQWWFILTGKRTTQREGIYKKWLHHWLHHWLHTVNYFRILNWFFNFTFECSFEWLESIEFENHSICKSVFKMIKSLDT